MNEQNPQEPILTQIESIDSIMTEPSVLPLVSPVTNPRRYFNLRNIVAIFSLSLFVAMGAFAIAPDTSTQAIKVETVNEEITLPATEAVLENETYRQVDQVRSDDTLASLFARLNIHDANAVAFLRKDAGSQAISTQLTPQNYIEAQTNAHGQLLHLEYEVNDTQFLYINRNGDSFKTSTKTLPLEKIQVLKSATIKNTLFDAADNADIPDAVMIQLIDALSNEIDFSEALSKGDHFNVVYEGFYNNGMLIKTGRLLAAEFVNDGKSYKAIHFGNADGKYAYYTPEGKSLYAAFLRSPLEYTRISSGFSTGRFHPILHTIRAHEGVDLVADTGTRIKAASNGTVDFIGVKGGYGNVVVLKHANNIETVYGHMSKFAEGLHQGDTVEQSQVIGYVGMTGLATGPHLHYEFLVNGVHHDPMTVDLPQSMPIDSRHKADFFKTSKIYSAQLNLLDHSNIAALE